MLKMAVCLGVVPCSLVVGYQRFTGACYLHHQGDNYSSKRLRMHRNEGHGRGGITTASYPEVSWMKYLDAGRLVWQVFMVLFCFSWQIPVGSILNLATTASFHIPAKS
jgi:hypothetical protein